MKQFKKIDKTAPYKPQAESAQHTARGWVGYVVRECCSKRFIATCPPGLREKIRTPHTQQQQQQRPLRNSSARRLSIWKAKVLLLLSLSSDYTEASLHSFFTTSSFLLRAASWWSRISKWQILGIIFVQMPNSSFVLVLLNISLCTRRCIIKQTAAVRHVCMHGFSTINQGMIQWCLIYWLQQVHRSKRGGILLVIGCIKDPTRALAYCGRGGRLLLKFKSTNWIATVGINGGVRLRDTAHYSMVTWRPKPRDDTTLLNKDSWGAAAGRSGIE